MAYSREGAGSPFPQGQDEEIAYEFDFSKWGSSPSNPSVTLYDTKNKNDDLSSSNLSGSAGVSGNIVTTPLVYDLVIGGEYKLVVQVTIDGNKLSAFIRIIGEL